MKKALALITAALVATPALAWGPHEQGILQGVAGLWLYQRLSQPQVVSQPPVVVQQPPIIYAPAPQQVIIQNPGVVCPQGLAPFYNQRFDNYGRAYYVFDGCR